MFRAVYNDTQWEFHKHYYFVPVGGRNISNIVSACLFVCLSAHILKNRPSKFHQIFCSVTSGHGSVPLWQQCNTLCTSGFVDDSVSRNAATGSKSSTTLCFVEFARWRHRRRNLVSTIALLQLISVSSQGQWHRNESNSSDGVLCFYTEDRKRCNSLWLPTF